MWSCVTEMVVIDGRWREKKEGKENQKKKKKLKKKIKIKKIRKGEKFCMVDGGEGRA